MPAFPDVGLDVEDSAEEIPETRSTGRPPRLSGPSEPSTSGSAQAASTVTSPDSIERSRRRHASHSPIPVSGPNTSPHAHQDGIKISSRTPSTTVIML